MPVEIPTPGSWWRRGDRIWEVTRVDLRNIQLVRAGSMESVTVPLARWPSDFQRMAGLAPDPGRIPVAKPEAGPVPAILIGGDAGHHFIRIRDLAMELDVDIVAHVPEDIRNLPGALPVRVELVIVLASHIDHRMSDWAKRTAAAQGLPLVSVPSNGFRFWLRDILAREQPWVLERPERSPRYGAASDDQPWWLWNGKTWTMVQGGGDAAWVDGGPPPEGCERGDSAVGGLLALVAVAAVITQA
jgi:hypothetical protein